MDDPERQHLLHKTTSGTWVLSTVHVLATRSIFAAIVHEAPAMHAAASRAARAISEDRQIRLWGAVGASNPVLLEATITAAWGSQRNTGTLPQWGGSGHLWELDWSSSPRVVGPVHCERLKM
jgi:hypothetical protein